MPQVPKRPFPWPFTAAEAYRKMLEHFHGPNWEPLTDERSEETKTQTLSPRQLRDAANRKWDE